MILPPPPDAAAQAADPPSTSAGELDSPARRSLFTAGIPRATLRPAATAGPVQAGVDLYENNPWYDDGTVTFIILKAFEPGYGPDSKFPARFPMAKASGRHCGAYLFGHPAQPAASAAAGFCHILDSAGFDRAADRAWLDHEVTDGKSPSYCAGWALEVCGQVDAIMGAPVTGIYTYTDFIRQGCCAGLGQYPLWFACPSPLGHLPAVSLGPWTAPVLVQYAVTAIDWDYFAGTPAQLAAFWTSAAPAPVPQPAPAPIPEGGHMLIITTTAPAGHAWAGTRSYLYAPGTAPQHIVSMADRAALEKALPAPVTVSWDQYTALGGT